MKKIIFFIVTLAAILVSCKKEYDPFVISATIEQLEQEDNSAKNYLENEHFIVFDPSDQFLLWKSKDNYALAHTGSKPGRENVMLYGEDASGDPDQNGIYNFSTSGSLYGIYPASAMIKPEARNTDREVNSVAIDEIDPELLLETPTIYYPTSWQYRDDYSFGKEAFPMVAYREASDGSVVFHSISGVARIQLYSDKVTGTVKQIEFQNKYTNSDVVDHKALKLAGSFEVQDITQEAPYVEAADGASDKITIKGINKPVGGGNLLTFYLPLPAQYQHDDGAPAVRGITKYYVRMKVTNQDGKIYFHDMKLDIRRNCLTMMQAVNITAWKDDEREAPSLEYDFAGCGTKDRPFLIYTYNDLVKVKNVYDNANRGTINGIKPGPNTYFKIVRTDIKLTSGTPDGERDAYGNWHYGANPSHSQMRTCGPWEGGIKNFDGHMWCGSNNPEVHGIINESQAPLFYSIAGTGQVDSITVRGSINLGVGTSKGDFSPLCITNNGTMRNCVNQCNIYDARATNYAASCDNIAGVCYTNNGLVTGCRNEGKLYTSGAGKKVAGICMNNLGIVQNCEVLAGAKMSSPGITTASGDFLAGTIGGIVHTNSGTVRSCYANINNAAGKGHIGGIVYENETDKLIQSCYVDGSYSSSTKYQVGGICHSNAGDIVDCRNQMDMLSGSTYVGGISATMTRGEIRNCYLEGSGQITTSQDRNQVDCGGFVGYMTGGSINNCYNVYRCYLGHAQQGSHVGGAVGRINATSDVRIWNSYATFTVDFCGSQSGSATINIAECYSVNGTIGASDVIKISKNSSTNDVTVYGESERFYKILNGNRNRNRDGDNKYREWEDGRHPVFK